MQQTKLPAKTILIQMHHVHSNSETQAHTHTHAHKQVFHQIKQKLCPKICIQRTYLSSQNAKI